MYPRKRFWTDAITWEGSVTPVVLADVGLFALYGALVGLVHQVLKWEPWGAVPAQFTAAILMLLLVLRTNAGYERWWEARKLWGGIVNQSRNLAIAALSYGPRDEAWRSRFVRLSAGFSHVSRRSLRGEQEVTELVSLLQSSEEAERVGSAQHMPSFVAARLSDLLQEASRSGGLDAMAFLAMENERAKLIDHIGGCERILKTPLPLVHTVKLRRFIVLYLMWLPLAVVGESWWLPALVTGLVSYPLIAIDQISVELENPFALGNLSHLPLNDICRTIEKNLLALLDSAPKR